MHMNQEIPQKSTELGRIEYDDHGIEYEGFQASLSYTRDSVIPNDPEMRDAQSGRGSHYKSQRAVHCQYR